jgi:hypothetical protein
VSGLAADGEQVAEHSGRVGPGLKALHHDIRIERHFLLQHSANGLGGVADFFHQLVALFLRAVARHCDRAKGEQQDSKGQLE